MFWGFVALAAPLKMVWMAWDKCFCLNPFGLTEQFSLGTWVNGFWLEPGVSSFLRHQRDPLKPSTQDFCPAEWEAQGHGVADERPLGPSQASWRNVQKGKSKTPEGFYWRSLSLVGVVCSLLCAFMERWKTAWEAKRWKRWSWQWVKRFLGRSYDGLFQRPFEFWLVTSTVGVLTQIFEFRSWEKNISHVHLLSWFSEPPLGSSKVMGSLEDGCRAQSDESGWDETISEFCRRISFQPLEWDIYRILWCIRKDANHRFWLMWQIAWMEQGSFDKIEKRLRLSSLQGIESPKSWAWKQQKRISNEVQLKATSKHFRPFFLHNKKARIRRGICWSKSLVSSSLTGAVGSADEWGICRLGVDF